MPEPASSAPTPAGEGVLPKTYDPAGTEARWQARLGGRRCTVRGGDPAAECDRQLHMGHAFKSALIDTIVRFQRLQGKNVLCLPGTDHASIAVQSILEKQLKAEGSSKDHLTTAFDGLLAHAALLGLHSFRPASC